MRKDSASAILRRSVMLAVSLFSLSGASAADLLSVGIDPGDWKPAENPQVAMEVMRGIHPSEAFVKFDVKKGPQEWIVIPGPIVKVDKRSRFYMDRTCKITFDVRAEGLDPYAAQIRVRQRPAGQTTGGAYTTNLRPNRLWETAAEVSNADKIVSWSTITGASKVYASTEQFALELWIAAPKTDKPASIYLRNFKVAESATITHVLTAQPETRGNIFFADKGALKADFVDSGKLKSCTLEALDEENRSRASVTGAAGTSALTLDLPGKGYYQIRATATYNDGSTITNTTSSAIVGESLRDDIRRNSRLGSMRVWGSGDLWSKSGANWDWGIGGIQLADFQLLPDGTVQPPLNYKPIAYPTDHQIVMTVGSFPKWILPKDQKTGALLTAGTDWKLLEKLFEAFARANPDVPYFCPMNEPDGFWRGSAADFVAMHKAIAAGIKKGNPRMKLFGPCMYSIRMADFRKYADLGLLDCLDGIVMHAYVNGSEPEGDFITNVAAMQSFLAGVGKSHLPVYITEYGWCTGTGDWQKVVPELTRSQYAARSLALLAAQPVDCIEYFCFKYSGSRTDPGYSLLYSDDTPTATFTAFANSLQWLSWTQKGDGRWLKFSPSLHMAVFARDQKSTAVAWTTSGAAQIRLSSNPQRIEDMMGRPADVMKNGLLQVSPSPVYFEFAEADALKNMSLLPPLSAAPGGTLTLPWPGEFAAAEMGLAINKANIAINATPGDYLIIGKSAGKWQGQPVTVLQPLMLESIDYKSSPDGRQMTILARTSSALPDGTAARATLTLADGTTSHADITFSSGKPATIALPIADFRMGQRYKGKLAIALTGRIPGVVERDIDTTLMACPQVSTDSAAWPALAAPVDFSNWGPQPEPLKAYDCAAKIQTGVGEKGFYLQIAVEDNIHRQSQPAADMWKEDSIQFAIDVDADKEWQPNNIGFGFNGHRIFEYGVALPSAGGAPMVWRWRGDAPGFNSACAEPRVIADVQRTGTQTIYKVLLPWETLGLSSAPTAGSNIGFALVVNDMDNQGNRHYLRLFEGIAEGKNPEKYGKLLIVK